MGAFRWFSLFFFIWLSCGSAQAERRVALVIGNSAYKSVPKLANPANDAALVGGMFKKAGFDSTDIKTDLNAAEMRRALREFGARARDAAVAVIYYAGHGIELDGTNYLIPIDATLETDSDVLDETVALDRALFAVEPAKQLRLVVLDACRDNPFAKSMKRTVAARAIGRGLAKVEPTSPNTMIAYAAKAGSTASDGDSRNSPFATALVERLPTPGLDLRKAFGFVRDDVLKATGYKQEPFVYGSLGGDDVALVPPKPAVNGPQASQQDAIRRDYELALQLGTRDGWTAFLAQYPDGFYAGLAKGQLNKIVAEEARLAAVEKARQAEDEKNRLAADRATRADQEKAAKVIADKQTAEKAELEQKVAAVAPAAPSSPSLSAKDLTTLVQSELRRVGCLANAADGDWNASSQKSLTMFNKHSGTKLDGKIASFEMLEAIRARQGRVCPLICDHGFRADGDQCARIACRAGYRLSDDNECEKIPEKKPVATRDDTKKRDAERRQVETQPSKPQASGQVVCDQGGCRPVRSGCRLVFGARGINSHGGSGSQSFEVCN